MTTKLLGIIAAACLAGALAACTEPAEEARPRQAPTQPDEEAPTTLLAQHTDRGPAAPRALR